MKVQQYETQVNPTGFQSAGTQRAVDTTAGLRKGFNSLTTQVQDFENRSAQLEAEQYVQEYARKSNELLMTGQDAYFRKQGKDSVDLAKPTMDALDEMKRGYIDKVKNPRARALLQKSLESRFTSDSARINAHSLKGQDQWDLSLAKTGVEQASEELSLNLNDPNKVKASKLAIRGNLSSAMRGLPQKSIDEKVQNAVSASIASGIQDTMVNDPAGAEALFKKYAGDLEPDHLKKLKVQLKTRVDKQKASDAAMALQDRYPGDLRAQRAAAKKMFKNDADVLDNVNRRLVNEYNLNRALDNAQKADNYQRLADDIFNHGVPYDQLMVTEQDAMLGLDISQQKNLQALEAMKAKGESPKQDWGAWTSLMEIPDDDEFLKQDPADYRLKLDDKHYDELLKMRRSMRSKDKTGSTEGSDKRQHIQTVLQQIKGEVKATHGGVNPEAEQQATNDIQAEVEQIERYKEAPATKDEIHRVTDEYFKARAFKNYNVYESTEMKSLATMTIDNVPDWFIKSTRNVLVERGYADPPTDFVETQALAKYKLKLFNKLRAEGKVGIVKDVLTDYVESKNK